MCSSVECRIWTTIVVSSTLCRKHEAVATVWTSLSATPSTPRRVSIREQVQVKPSSSEWEVINDNSSLFYAEYPKCLAVSVIMRNFAVDNRENGRRLDNPNEFDCTRLAPSLQTSLRALGPKGRFACKERGLHRPCSVETLSI